MARQKRPKTNYTAVSGSSARALFTNASGGMHGIEMTFLTSNGEEVIVTMPHEVATEVLNSGIAAYQAIMTPLKIARTVPFG